MADIRLLTPQEFPSLLKEIPDCPEQLYLRGTLPPEGYKCIAVVGSRRMSPYGKDACEELVRGLSGYPLSIISGLALGIDAVSHKAALDAGLHTLAIPGSGISDKVLYPRSNYQLGKEILENGGGIMSEEEPDFRARPESFPKRNRIMAGMSHATLLIEAGEKSGTMITARLTTEYNRELLVVPHSIFADGGAGGHIFLKLGATPIRSSEDILEVLGFEETEKAHNVSLSEEEALVIKNLASPRPRDELIRLSGLKTSDANVLLLQMELKGLIKETLGEIRKNI